MQPSKRNKTGKVEKRAIEDKVSRVNIKSKRKRTLLRKAIEVSQLCSLDILIIIRDNETRKIYEYNSGKEDHKLFTLQKAVQAKIHDQYFSIVYNDTNYDNLIPSGKNRGSQVLDTEEDIRLNEIKM